MEEEEKRQQQETTQEERKEEEAVNIKTEINKVGRIPMSMVVLFFVAGAMGGIMEALADRYAPQAAEYTPIRLGDRIAGMIG